MLKSDALFRLLVSFVLLPNLPFLLARQFLPVNRAIISLDYLGVGLIAALLPAESVLIIILFAAVFVLDLVKTFAGIYYFSFGDAIRHIGNLVHVSLWLTLPRIVLVLGVSYVLARLALKISRNTQPMAAARVLGTVFALCLVLSLPASPLVRRVPVANSNLVSEVRASYAMLYPDPPPPLQAASMAISPVLRSSNAPKKVVLIVEEALGLSENPAITDKVLAPLLGADVAARYQASRGSVEFHGPTLMGEARELCHLLANPLDVAKVPEKSESCLPMQLRKAGFSTTAIHGFTKAFFHRESWYPTIGFERLIFREKLGNTAGTCGVGFPGACDPKLALLIHKLLVTSPPEEKQFIYWLTLNSHEPVADETARTSKLECDDLPEFGGQDICNMVRVQFNTNEAIENLVTSRDLPPTMFVIVGDHAPPLSNIHDRDQWSQREVPWVVLMPRTSGLPSSGFGGETAQVRQAN